jgi:hypothetical protein
MKRSMAAVSQVVFLKVAAADWYTNISLSLMRVERDELLPISVKLRLIVHDGADRRMGFRLELVSASMGWA